MAKFPTDVDSDTIIQGIAPAGESGDRWIRTRKTTSRPRRKEPPDGPQGPRKTVHTQRGGHTSEAQSPAEGTAGRKRHYQCQRQPGGKCWKPGSAGVSYLKLSKARGSDHPSHKPSWNPRLGRVGTQSQNAALDSRAGSHERLQKRGPRSLLHEIF